MLKTFPSRPELAVRCAFVCATAAALASTAFAHGTLESASPANGASLVAPPAEIRLTFNEPLEQALTSVNVFTASGQHVATPDQPRIDDKKIVVLRLPTLSSGAYQARWATVGHDGHRIHGDLAFTVK